MVPGFSDMKRVCIESPYRGTAYYSVEQHRLYLQFCLLDCLSKGEAPFASHALYPAVLDDDDPVERGTGIKAGYVWGELADVVAVYSDLGVSPGMKESVAHWKAIGKPIEWRAIDHNLLKSVHEAAP